MSDLKFPAEVEQRAISCSVASSDHMVCDVDGHVINDGRSTRSSELENHNTDLEGQTDEYADEDDDDDGLMTDKNTEATAAVRSRLSRLKSERVRLIEDMKNQRKRYEKYLDKLTCQLFKVLLSQKKLKSDCSSLIERVSALETDNKRLKEALDKWSSQSKGLNSLQQVMIEPINYLINRPTGGKNPVSTFISSISDQQNSGQTLEGQSELFFFHTHPPIIGQAIASLRRLQLLQSTSRCCRHSLADEAAENFRPEKQGLENDYYNVDSLSQWLAKDWLPGGCSCSRCIRDNDDSQACYGSAYSALYDEVYQERPLVRLAEDKELDLMTEESQFNCSSGNVASVAGNNEFENCEGDDDDVDDDDDDDNKKLDARYDQVPDEFHHHCHHSFHQGFKDHNQDQRHGHQDNEIFHHHHTPPSHHHNHHHHSKEEFREHPYQNLKKPNVNSESRESNTAASLYSGFSTFEKILQPSKTTFSSPSLAPLSSSFYYTPGHYSNPVDKDSTDEIKAQDFCSKRRQVKKNRSRPKTRFSFDSEVTGRSDHQFDDSLDESQGQFTQLTAPDCRFPTTATYRIKNAAVARLVPIDRVIAEDVDEVVESKGIINSSDEPILRWSGRKADDCNCFSYGAEKANGSANESDVSFSCPWTLRMDRGIWADSTNNHEGQNIFEDECGDCARLSKPLRKNIEKPIELRKNCSKNVVHSDNEEGEQQSDVTLSDSSKFLNAFGFLLSQDPSSLNSQLFLRDLVSGIDISPPNSESVSCLSLSPNSDEKAESLFESSSACLTDALGRSMDESSLSSFLVFETSGQGLQSTSETARKDDEGPDYTALLNRNFNSKLPNHNPEDQINRGMGKPSETGRTNLTKNSIKSRESHLRPRFSDHQRPPAKDQQRRESKDLGSIDNNPIRFNHNSNLTTSQMTLGTSVNSAAVPAQNGSPGRSSVSFSQLNSLPSPVLRKANLFPNSKIPGSPNISTRAKNSTPNHTTPSSIQNTLHQSMSVPFRNLPAPTRQSSRNSLPPLNQIRTPNCKPASLSKAGGFFRLNSKPIGSTTGAQSADIGQSVKTSPKSTTKIFKFSSPKTKRSSVTLTLHGNTEEVDHVTPPGGTGKKSGVCKTV